jgi:hypothetical protein
MLGDSCEYLKICGRKDVKEKVLELLKRFEIV